MTMQIQATMLDGPKSNSPAAVRLALRVSLKAQAPCERSKRIGRAHLFEEQASHYYLSQQSTFQDYSGHRTSTVISLSSRKLISSSALGCRRPNTFRPVAWIAPATSGIGVAVVLTVHLFTSSGAKARQPEPAFAQLRRGKQQSDYTHRVSD